MAKKKTSKLWVVSKEKDQARKAKRQGKRVSADGNVYYESRLNRSDVNPKRKLKKGGILSKKVSLKDIFSGK
jgi:hypothetical protein